MPYEVIDRERTGTGTLTLGHGASVGRGASVDISASVMLAEGAVISEDVLILTHDHNPADIAHKRYSTLVIGRGAWVCSRAIILESCNSIGDGAVVGAGSVVTRDIPPNELWAGNPARFIRTVR